MPPRHIASSIEGVVQLIAASYLRHGYYWYITGQIPANKSPTSVDTKLVNKYQIDVSDWERNRRKKAGLANAQYLRCERWFVLLVTEGHHPLKQPTDQGGEGDRLKDFRRHPLMVGGYSISYRRDGVSKKGQDTPNPQYRAHVRLDPKTYRVLKSYFASLAVHRTAVALAKELSDLPFIRYAPVRRQLLNVARMVNKRRKPHNYEPIPYARIGLRRTIVKAYSENENVPKPLDQNEQQ